LTLKKEEIHFFNDIAYWHVPFTHCPTGDQLRLDLKCHCNPKDNFDWKGYSCTSTPQSDLWTSNILIGSSGTSNWFDVMGLEKPEGWEDEK